MRHRTAEVPVNNKPERDPIDVGQMRATTAQLIGPDDAPEALPASGEELETLTLKLRGHIQLMIPEVQKVAAKEPADSIPRYCALACVGEAKRKLTAPQSAGEGGAVAHARRLARSLNALCDHYGSLGGQS